MTHFCLTLLLFIARYQPLHQIVFPVLSIYGQENYLRADSQTISHFYLVKDLSSHFSLYVWGEAIKRKRIASFHQLQQKITNHCLICSRSRSSLTLRENSLNREEAVIWMQHMWVLMRRAKLAYKLLINQQMQNFEENPESNKNLEVKPSPTPKRVRTRKHTVYIFGQQRMVLLSKIANKNYDGMKEITSEIDIQDILIEGAEQASLI